MPANCCTIFPVGLYSIFLQLLTLPLEIFGNLMTKKRFGELTAVQHLAFTVDGVLHFKQTSPHERNLVNKDR